MRTPHYYGQFALSPGKESRYIFSTVNPLNRETPVNLDIFSRGGGGGASAYESGGDARRLA